MSTNSAEIIIWYKDEQVWKQCVPDNFSLDKEYDDCQECSERERDENELHQYYMDIAKDYEEYEQLCKDEEDLYQFLMIKDDYENYSY